MHDKAANVRGAIFYWSAGEMDSGCWANAWEPMGWGPFVPDPQTRDAALKAAMTSVCAGKRRLVRPLDAGGYSLIAEDDLGGVLSHHPLLTCKVDEKAYGGGLIFDAFSHPDAAGIAAEYQRQCSIVTPAAAGRALVRFLEARGAVSLRPSGGFYWVREDRIQSVTAVLTALERSGAGAFSAYRFLADVDDAAAKAILDGAVREITAEIKRISDDLAVGKLGKRALEARKREACAAHARAVEFETLLGANLDTLKASAEQAEADAAAAALAAMCEDEKVAA